MPQDIRAVVFGSAAGFPTRTRPRTTSIGLWRKGALYLVDAGDCAAASLVDRGVAPDAVRAVLITHTHADHTAGLPMLLQWLQLTHRGEPLPLYLPADALDEFRRVMDFHYLRPALLGFDLELRPVTPGRVYEEAGVVVDAAANRHLDSFAATLRQAGAAKVGHSFSYAMSVDQRRVVFSGDIATAGEVHDLVSGADLAFVELAHVAPEDLGRALSGTGLTHLVAVHVRDEYEPEEDELPGRINAAGFEGKVTIARDGTEVAL